VAVRHRRRRRQPRRLPGRRAHPGAARRRARRALDRRERGGRARLSARRVPRRVLGVRGLHAGRAAGHPRASRDAWGEHPPPARSRRRGPLAAGPARRILVSRVLLRIIQLMYFMAPAYVANMVPPFLKYWKGWNPPISRRWLGSHKTVLGFTAGVLGGVLTAAVQSHLGWWTDAIAVRE